MDKTTRPPSAVGLISSTSPSLPLETCRAVARKVKREVGGEMIFHPWDSVRDKFYRAKRFITSFKTGTLKFIKRPILILYVTS